MDFHEWLSLVSILIEIVAIFIGVLEICEFKVKDLLRRRDDPKLTPKGTTSKRRKLFFYVVVILFTILLLWQIIDARVWEILSQHKTEIGTAIGRMIAVSFISIVIGTLIGGVAAYLITREKKYVIEEAVTEIIIGGSIYFLLALPAIVIIYISYYGGFTDSLWVASVVALSINLSPFVAKILVSAFKSISREQIDAAKVFGYTDRQIAIYFKLNYVLQYSLQPLLVEYYTTVKLSSLTAYIGFMEVLHLSQDIIKETQDPVKGYLILSISYIIIVAPIAFFADTLDKKNRARKNE